MEKALEQKKPFTKTEQKLIDELAIGTVPEVVENPFSGVSVTLEPQGVALYDFIKGYEITIAQGKTTNIRQFDMARGLFRKLYPNSYMELLD